MPGTVNFRIDGLKQLEAAMKELGQRASTRIADQGLRAGTDVIVRLARQRVPVHSGEMRKAISRRRVKRQRQHDTRTWIMGVERPTSRRFHLLEFGTAHMPAQPFMRPALDEGASAAFMKMAETMARGINREAMRLAKK